jgi:uncharacterized repeat protein (TIGR03803 family)
LAGTTGDLYGTTQASGAYGYGTVFKITPSGTLTTLYSFCAKANCTDGAVPVGALIQASDGKFYGTTVQGGVNNACDFGNPGCGTIFRITPTGVLTTLYSFCAEPGCADGDSPNAGLVQATNGDFYGPTMGGGANSYGTVFSRP